MELKTDKKYKLQDLIDIPHFQHLQDQLNKIYSFPSAIIDNDGNILTATAWQDICTQFYRKSGTAEKECIKSDKYIISHLHEADPAVSYKCPHGLVDNAAPIIIDGIHYGNFFTGQFFLEKPDLDFYREQAVRYGFDEEAFIAAVEKVPIWTREQLHNYLYFIKGLITIISESALKNLREIEHRRAIELGEKRIGALIRTTTDGFWITSGDGRILEVNESYCAMSGYSAAELLEMRISDLDALDSADDVAARIKTIIADGAALFETQHRRKDGSIFDVEVSTTYLSSEDGNFICFCRDITGRKQANETLRVNEERQRLINNAVRDQIYGYDRDNRFTYANRVLCENLGISTDGIIGKTYWELGFPEKQCLEWDELHRQVYATGSKTVITSTPMPDGTVHYFEVNLTTVKNDDGAIIGLAGVNRDITERKLSEDLLRDSRNRLELALNSAQMGIWDWDIVNNRMVWDDRMFQLYGITKKPASYGVEIWKSGVHPDDIDAAWEACEAAIRGDRKYDIEFRIQRPDGAARIIKADGIVIRDDKGTAVRMIGINHDITDRKAAEEARLKYEHQLQQTQKLESLGVLAGGIAHDFNNLLGGIYGYIDLALGEVKDEKRTLHLAKAAGTIERARSLTRQLLTFARGGEPVRETAALFPFVHEAVKFALSGSNVSYRSRIQPDLALCNYDRHMIGQVIDNIIINAKQAMPGGGSVLLSAKNKRIAPDEHPSLAGGDYILISIKDSGTGIPAESLPSIFDPFYTTKTTGHGLGLTSSYSIVKRHGGCIDVESEPGKGSTFHIYLPAAGEPVPPPAAAPPAGHAGRGPFLIMDDEEVIRDTCRAMLEALGFTAVCTREGKEAVAFFTAATEANRKIAGMIFDLTIPGGMSGEEAILEIRKTDPNMPVFVTSGYAEDPIMANPAAYGFTASICKPFKKSDLAELLGRYLPQEDGETSA